MPRTRLFRSRADRAIGLARLILAAASIAALFLDPVLSRSGSNFTFGIGSALFGSRRDRAPCRTLARLSSLVRAHGSRETKDLSNLC
jgi:hypothetical protein